jgi:hypothetical protein
MNAHVANLMQKEVSRKQFLGMLGLVVLSVFGFSTIIKLLTGKSLESHRVVSGGYGVTEYGGGRG